MPAPLGSQGGRAATASLSRRLIQSSRRLHLELCRLQDQWPELTAALQAARALRVADEAAALAALEAQKTRVDAEQSKGLFAGLDPLLTQSLTFFIQQAEKQARESGLARYQLSSSGEAAASSASASGAASAASTLSFLASVLASDSTAASLSSLASVLEITSAAMSPPFATFEVSIGAGGVESIARSALELSVLYSDWQSQSRLKDQLQLAEVSRQLEVGRQLDLQSSSAISLSPEDEERLQEAQSELITLSSSHLRQLAAVVDGGRLEEQKQAELALKDLQAKEAAAAAKEAELEADAAARRAADRADGDEDEAKAAADAAELLSALQALQAELHDERCRAQLELQSIHSRVEAKTRAVTAALERQQEAEAAAVLARYEAVRGEVEGRAARATSVQVEGVDLQAVKSEVERGGAASGREEALRTFHAQALQELQREHAQALRLQAEGWDEAHKAELQQTREDWDDERRREEETQEAEWQTKVDAEADSTQVAALRAQQADERRKRERKAKEEWKKVEAEAKARHKADDEAKAAELRATQAAERAKEVEEQTAELAELRLFAQRQREEAALRSLLSPSNRAQAKPLIAALTANRHAQELQALMRRQQKATAEETTRRVDAEHAELAHAREAVQQLRADGLLSAEEAAERLAGLEADFAPAEVSGRVFAAVAEGSAAAVARLQRAQWEEQKALMRSLYPDEAFTSPEWADPSLDLSAITRAHAQRMADEQRAQQRELEQLESAEQRRMEEAALERRGRLAELEHRIAQENQLVRAQFAAQLRTANEEHEERVRSMAQELQAALAQAGTEAERAALVAELQPLIDEEKAQHSALLSSAAAQFETELELRNERERVQVRRQLDEDMNATLREARKEKEDKLRARAQEGEAKAEATRQATKAAVLALIDRGRQFRRTRQKGMRAAVRQMMKAHAHGAVAALPASTAAAVASSTAATADGLPSTQLAAIEALLLRLQPPAQRTSPAESTQFSSPPGVVPMAVSEKELGPRAVATTAAVQRLIDTLDGELRQRGGGGQLTLRVTRRPQSGVRDAAVTALPPSGLPLPHLCTLDRERRVLWLWWDGEAALSSILVSALFRLVGVAAGDDATDSPAFHAALHRCLAVLLHHCLASTAASRAVEGLVATDKAVEGMEEEADEAVDAVTASWCEKLQSWAAEGKLVGEEAAEHRRKEREEAELLLQRLEQLQRQHLQRALQSPMLAV